MIEKKIEIEIPMIPNFIRSKGGSRIFALKEFSEDELIDIGQAWTRKLIERSKLTKSLEDKN